MEGEVKEKLEVAKKSTATKSTVKLTLDIPKYINNKMKKYRRENNGKKNKDFNLKTSYVEFLKEKLA